jgi:hypothetical protein
VQRQGAKHGWVGRPVIQILAAHLKLLKERPPILKTRAALLA